METPFYEQWWFLLVMALSSLLVILLVVFSLLLLGQSKKYRNCSAGGEPRLPGAGADTSGFPLPGLGCPHHAHSRLPSGGRKRELWAPASGRLCPRVGRVSFIIRP